MSWLISSRLTSYIPGIVCSIQMMMSPEVMDDRRLDFEECPWMLDFLGPHAAKPVSFNSACMDLKNCKQMNLDDDASFSLMDELRRTREALHDTSSVESEPLFVVIVRGGQWTLAHHGVEFDGFRGIAKHGPAKDFCRHAGLNQSATFAVNMYGLGGSEEMAKWWCARMSYLCRTWMASQPDVFEEGQVRPNVVPACPDDVTAMRALGNPNITRRIDGIAAMAYP